ncbi:hypothetical protein TH63_09435 [Rufibacter radiotolerans]|uniref:Uncharacterized protein n=1 Tax=Rufibacter radiotolerans TaxID=1379910 RepID=A0A0H4VJ21_9BACT|nr:hypothetical protein TH63_09435 [Rufibacter radiotolerans]
MEREIYLRRNPSAVKDGQIQQEEMMGMLYRKLTLLQEPGLLSPTQLQNLRWEVEKKTERGDWLHLQWEMAT